MPNRTFNIYEVPNSYVNFGTGPNGGNPTISGVFKMNVVDNNGKLQATPGSAGSGQVISLNGAPVDSYKFFYNDTISLNGSTTSVKTFQLTINGNTHSYIMNTSTNSLPAGIGAGSSYSLTTYNDYTPLKYQNVACFGKDTLIETKTGPRPVQDLAVGDLVRTMDHGYQAIRWIGGTRLSLRDLIRRPELRPVFVPANSLGTGLPARDLTVSPQHRLMLGGWEVQLNFALDQVLAPAVSLCGKSGIHVDQACTEVEYFHFMFDHHEVVFSEGLPSESFLVGDTIRDGMDQAQLEEILTLFPELATRKNREAITPARPILKTFEARTLGCLVA